jgi:transposase
MDVVFQKGDTHMFAERTTSQSKAEYVMIDDLVPAGHLLRKVDEVIDFAFINDICRPYYCADNGRPAIEPVILFKMLLIGYLYGIRSERRLVEEVKVNVAYRWFWDTGSPTRYPTSRSSGKTACAASTAPTWCSRSSTG